MTSGVALIAGVHARFLSGEDPIDRLQHYDSASSDSFGCDDRGPRVEFKGLIYEANGQVGSANSLLRPTGERLAGGERLLPLVAQAARKVAN